MKLVTYKRNAKARLGFVKEGLIVDLGDQGFFAGDMKAFLAAGEDLMQGARQLEAQIGLEGDKGEGLPLEKAELLAPVPNPEKILCIGLNYADHAREARLPIPTDPVIFGKYANAALGSGQAICIPPVTDEVDYEAELAVVIGKEAYRVPESKALDYVAGYMNFNDVSARNLQRQDGQWMKGKFLDTFAPMGPWLCTADEITDPGQLSIQLRLNGQVMQNSHTKNLIFSVARIVSYLSQMLTLKPGDIIATGTPAGVGFSRKPPVFLQDGDTVEVEIEGLGTLLNSVRKLT